MMPMDRTVTKKGTLADMPEGGGYVPGTPGERIAMVWPLTREVASLNKAYDVERRLQRDVTVLRRRER
jgi:hypothetical protein